LDAPLFIFSEKYAILRYMTIIVLGGGIARNGILPDFVKTRLEKAKEIFIKNNSAKILFCGRYSFLYSKSNHPLKTEAQAGKEYLAKIGVPKKFIYLENKSKDTIGNAYYAKKLYFIPRQEKEATIITSDFHLERSKFIFKKIFGTGYDFKFIATPSNLKSGNKAKIFERQKELLKKTQELLKNMPDGNHNFLKGKLYKIKYYREKRPSWVANFVSKGNKN